MTIAIGTYLEFLTFEGKSTGHRFQNFFPGEVRQWDDNDYLFAGFGYSGTSIDLQGGNIDASLVFAVNDLTLNHAKLAADESWVTKISTVFLDNESFLETEKFQTDEFGVTGFEHDSLRLQFRLSSPLDSVSGDVPRRRLIEKLVGALPSTGNIVLS